MEEVLRNEDRFHLSWGEPYRRRAEDIEVLSRIKEHVIKEQGKKGTDEDLEELFRLKHRTGTGRGSYTVHK